MPAQHQIEYCHVDIKTGEILEGPMALPQNWGNVAGFKHLKPAALAKYDWYPVRDDGAVPEGAEYVTLFLPEGGVVVKAPAGNRIFRGGQRYAILHLHQMFEFYAVMPFYSDVLGTVHRFSNKPCEQLQRQNCLTAGLDYSCLAETMDREFLRVTVPHENIKVLIKDAAGWHNQQLDKLFVGLEDIRNATNKELVAMLDTNMLDYYG